MRVGRWGGVVAAWGVVACRGAGSTADAGVGADASADASAGVGAGAGAGASASAGAGAGEDAAGERRALTGVAQVAVGQQSVCWRMESGRVLCAGWVYEGTREDGRGADAWSVARPVAVGDATFVAVGWGYACAARRGGGVACWGDHARYSRGSRDERREVRAIEGVHDAVQVAIGLDHACALSADGAIACWGGDMHGEVGAKPEDVPADGLVHVEGTGRAVDIVAPDFEKVRRRGGSRHSNFARLGAPEPEKA